MDEKMTDIEQRKAAALRDLKSIQCAGDAADYCDEYEDILEKLLAPSPQSPDNEVEYVKKFALDYWQSKPDIYGQGFKNIPDLAEKIFDRFIKAAQQPRQEWMDMEPTAYRVSVDSCKWFFDTPDEARDYIRMHLSEGGALITPLYKLPSPPEDKP